MKLTKTKFLKKSIKASLGAVTDGINNTASQQVGAASGVKKKPDILGAINPLTDAAGTAILTGIENQQNKLAAENKAPSLGATVGKGAVKGFSATSSIGLNPAALAATGGLSALLPVATAGIGAGINYFKGKKDIKNFNTEKDKNFKEAQAAQKNLYGMNAQYNQVDAANRGYSAQGTSMGFYKKGGKMSCLKGGKLTYRDGGKVPGGKIVPVTSDTKLAIGKTHAQGGIRLNSNVEVENGEPIVDKGDHTLVVSNNLKNPATGNTLAKDDIKLALDIEANKNKSSQVAKNAVVASQLKREKLHQYQQAMNGDQKEPGMAEKGGKFRPINVLTKPVKKGPFLAKNGSKIRPINVLSKPYVKPPLRAKDGAEIDFTKLKRKDGPREETDNTTLDEQSVGYRPVSKARAYTPDTAKDFGFKYQPSTVAPAKTKIDNKGYNFGKSLPSSNPSFKTMPVNVTNRKIDARTNLQKITPTLQSGATKLGKIAAYSAPGVLDYVNQKGTIAKLKNIEVPKAKEQAYGNLAKVSMENDRAAIRKQQANYNANISGQLADSQTAALMKANVANASMDAIAKVNQEERNQNKAISNAQTEMNLKIQDSNFAKDYAYKVAKMEKNIDLANRESTAKSKLYSDLRDVQNTFRQEKYIDKDTALKMAALDERGQRYLEATGASPKDFWKSTFKRGGKLSKLKVK